MSIFEIGPLGTVHVYGVKLVGVTAENAGKLAISLLFIFMIAILRYVVRLGLRFSLRNTPSVSTEFWARQGLNLFVAILLVVGLLSVWFDDPVRLSTALGLITAGLAFALQKVVTSVAGYFVILRGRTFNVGDRIVMGGVRGDVIALGFIQTSIMEMGQPPDVQTAEPAMWVKSRQYTGRIVTVPNSKVFEEAVYNYSLDFHYIWEEMTLPIVYGSDAERAEDILMRAARQYQISIEELAEEEARELQRRYFAINISDFSPRVFYRLTDNWLELAVRFLTTTHSVRDVKDRMSRQILKEMKSANIDVASSTLSIVSFPSLEVKGDRLVKRATG